jgi:hypothetical protein
MSTVSLTGETITVPMNSWTEMEAAHNKPQTLTTSQLRGSIGVAILTGSEEGHVRAYLQHYDLFDNDASKALQNAVQIIPQEGEKSRALIMAPAIREDIKGEKSDRRFQVLDKALNDHFLSICFDLLGPNADVSVRPFNQADVARRPDLGRLSIELGRPTVSESCPKHLVVANSIPMYQTGLK